MSKKYIGFIIILTCSFFLLPTNIYSSSTEEDYELQEKCGRQCEEIYNTTYNGGKIQTSNGGSIYYNYENHYNKKLNKCFMLINEQRIRGTITVIVIKLMDVNENKLYGTWVVGQGVMISCHVLGKRCKKYDEWVLRVKPYMEE